MQPAVDLNAHRESDCLYDEVAAGQYIGGEGNPVSPRTLQRWREQKIGPAYLKISHLVRYRKSQLDAYLANCERSPIEAA